MGETIERDPVLSFLGYHQVRILDLPEDSRDFLPRLLWLPLLSCSSCLMRTDFRQDWEPALIHREGDIHQITDLPPGNIWLDIIQGSIFCPVDPSVDAT